MKLTSDFESFAEETGSICNWHKLISLGIPSRFYDAAFALEELPKLQEFCRSRRGFHIISIIAPMAVINCVDPRALHFRLADGNPDPTICYFDTRTPYPALL